MDSRIAFQLKVHYIVESTDDIPAVAHRTIISESEGRPATTTSWSGDSNTLVWVKETFLLILSPMIHALLFLAANMKSPYDVKRSHVGSMIEIVAKKLQKSTTDMYGIEFQMFDEKSKHWDDFFQTRHWGCWGLSIFVLEMSANFHTGQNVFQWCRYSSTWWVRSYDQQSANVQTVFSPSINFNFHLKITISQYILCSLFSHL